MFIFAKLMTCCKTTGPGLLLMLGYFIFLLVGGYLFVVLEQDHDIKVKEEKRTKFLQVLDRYNISHNNSMIMDIISKAIDARDVKGLNVDDYTVAVASDWSVGSSLFFAATIVTTIGYGNIAPTTSGGKAFCIFLALLGIPFTGVVLGKLGVALSNLIKRADDFIENGVKRCFPKKSKEENVKGHVRSIQLAFVMLFFIVMFLLVPAAAMIRTESNWKYFDAFYFCFISLTTIGLGDFTPGASSQGIKFSEGLSTAVIKSSILQLSVMLYLLLGLAALSIILALLGSMLKSAAEKTIKGGTDIMNAGGKVFADSGGKELLGGARRLASSFKRRTMDRLSESDSTVNEEKTVTETANDKLHSGTAVLKEEDHNENHVDGVSLNKFDSTSIIIENKNSYEKDYSQLNQEDSLSPAKSPIKSTTSGSQYAVEDDVRQKPQHSMDDSGNVIFVDSKLSHAERGNIDV